MDQNKPGQQGQRPEQDQPDRPNPNTGKEPAEGSRETTRGGQGGNPNPQQGQPGSGVSNRPADREQQEQKDVPPRGQTKDENRNT